MSFLWDASVKLDVRRDVNMYMSGQKLTQSVIYEQATVSLCHLCVVSSHGVSPELEFGVASEHRSI